MKNKKPDIIYSDPVKDIISNPPRRIIRWGTSVIFLVFAVLIFFSWLIKYPDVIPAQVEITTLNPPVTLVSKITGRINELYVSDGENVKQGQLLAVMETAASISEINLLRTIIDTIKDPDALLIESFPDFYQLGELQEYYATFLKVLSDYNTYTTNDLYGSKIRSITQEIEEIQKYIERILIKEELVTSNLEIEKRKFERDSILYSGDVYSETDLENSRQSFIRTNLELQEVRLDHSAKTIELSEKMQLLQDYRINRQTEKEKLNAALEEALLNLKAQMKIWQNNYLLISPVEGRVAFTMYWSKNQSVNINQPVLSVVPEDPGDFVGRINLKMQRSGKVETGQDVNIKLSGFPYLEYGMIRGVVTSKSLVPAGDAYIIEVNLPEGLKTLYGRELDFTQNMQGTAEIITEDLRLIQKIINPFRYLISRNKRR
jgi:multidrug resistance efflux pump